MGKPKNSSRSKGDSKKPSSRMGIEWSQQWSEDDQRWFWEGYDSKGVRYSQWEQPNLLDDTIPREPQLDEIAAGVDSLSVAPGSSLDTEYYVHQHQEQSSHNDVLGDPHTGQYASAIDIPSESKGSKGKGISTVLNEDYDEFDAYASSLQGHQSAGGMHLNPVTAGKVHSKPSKPKGKEKGKPMASVGSIPYDDDYNDAAPNESSWPANQSYGGGYAQPVNIENKRKGIARGSGDYEELHPSSLKTHHSSHDKHSKAVKAEGKGKAKARVGVMDNPEFDDEPGIYPEDSLLSPEAGYDPHTLSSGDQGHYPTESNIDEPEDPEFQQALEESKRAYYRPPGYEGESSAYGMSSYGPTYEVPEELDEEDEGDLVGSLPSSTAKVPSLWPLKNMITGTPGTYEYVDSRFKVEYSAKFQLGEIFKVLWSEPRGEGQSKPETLKRHVQGPFTDVVKTKVDDTYLFYAGMRRFIIVGTETGSSTCVPILTYEKRGCTKKGIKPENHGIIYTPPKHPARLEKEPKLGFPAVAMKITIDGEALAKESRVNYSKLVTIEHNVKVLFIGRLYPDSLTVASDAVDTCWARKTTQKQRKKHHH